MIFINKINKIEKKNTKRIIIKIIYYVRQRGSATHYRFFVQPLLVCALKKNIKTYKKYLYNLKKIFQFPFVFFLYKIVGCVRM